MLGLAVVVAGWEFVRWVSEYGRTQERDDLAALTAAAAASLDPEQIGLLRGIAEDKDSAVLADVRAQLRRIRDAIPKARFVHLVALRDGRVVFLAHSEPADSVDYSAPGDIYEEAPDAFVQAFASVKPLVHGPYHDHWGHWITGLAVVARPDGTAPSAVLGIDTGAQQYLADVAGHRSFALVIAGLFAAIAVLAGIIVCMLQRFNVQLESDLHELRAAQERLRLAGAVIENMSEGVLVTDARLVIESVNPAFERITGYAASEAVGQTPKILFSGRHDDAFFQQLHERVDAQGNWRGEIWNRRRSGQIYPQRTSIGILRDADGGIRHYATVFSDNTLENQLEAKLREMSAVDGLTGIANRRSFDDVFTREWARALRDHRPLSLVMADIDYFKGYNDRHGHLAGDQCLQHVAGAIAGVVNRASDLAARYGGEEFAVILPEADAAAGARVAEKIRAGVAALALPHGASDVADEVTISLGVATVIPHRSLQATDLVAAADQALYQAKLGGRNRVVAAAALAGGDSRSA